MLAFERITWCCLRKWWLWEVFIWIFKHFLLFICTKEFSLRNLTSILKTCRRTVKIYLFRFCLWFNLNSTASSRLRKTYWHVIILLFGIIIEKFVVQAIDVGKWIILVFISNRPSFNQRLTLNNWLLSIFMHHRFLSILLMIYHWLISIMLHLKRLLHSEWLRLRHLFVLFKLFTDEF